MRINATKRVITVKLVYYGPGLSGKTTNLKCLYGSQSATQRGELVQLDTETERTIFFDYFPVMVAKIGGFRVKADLFTVPGQSFYAATRRAVIDGADGVVFVADSSRDREEANIVSRADMMAALEANGRSIDEVPLVYQWNKRDIDNPLSVKVLERMLNPGKAPSLEAVASDGVGVKETEKLILRQMFDQIRRAHDSL